MQLLSAEGHARLLENRHGSHGEAGAAWVNALPKLVARVAERWSLAVEPHYENLSYNYVAPVRTRDGDAAVLKLCMPDHDFLCEAEALRLFDGHACARPLEVDREAGAILLERMEPGAELHTLHDDVAETSAVAAVMRQLQRPYSGLFPFPVATEWINDALDPNAIPALKQAHPWIDKALARIVEIASEPYDEVLLHGDLHHGNVLSSSRAPWLAIDPKGVIGDPAWELAPFLFNRLERSPAVDWPRIIRRRADQIAEELSLDRERVYAWSAVRAIQSAFWSLRDEPGTNGPVYEGAIVCAQALTDSTPG
jgi:streptomycin 6-kinase